MGRKLTKQREDFPLRTRCAFPEKLSEYHKGDLQTSIPGICPHLPHTLLAYNVTIGRDSLEHLFQAFHLLYRSVLAGRRERTRTFT